MDAPPKGPYVKAAVFCERSLVETDGVPSLIRIVDRINQTIVGSGSSTFTPIRFPLVLIVMLNPGDAKGSAEFELGVEAPNGIRSPIANGTIHYEAPDHAVNIRADVDMAYDQEGIYWFDVKVDAALMSRMPLTVRFNRITPAPAPGS